VASEDYDFLNSISQHQGRPGDTSNFDPVFAHNLAAAIQDANAHGMHVGLESAYRTPGQTGSSFDRSGRSLHSYGLAADVNGIGSPGSDTARQWYQFATAHGLFNPYGYNNKAEFNHYQGINHELTQAEVPAYQQAFAQRTPGTTLTSLAYNNPDAPAAGVKAISAASPQGNLNAPTGGNKYTSNPFIAALGDAESNWRNIYSTVDKDYPGQPGSKSQGYLQIDTPTWRQYAQPLGITAPNAMSASPDDQIRVASLIPMNRFGGRTLGLLHKQFGDFDASKTVGDLAAQFGGGAVASAGARNQLGQPTGQPAPPPGATPGTSLATTTPAATPAQPQSWWEKATTNQKDAQGNEKPGTSPLAKLGAEASKITKAPDVGEMQQPQQAPDTSQAIYPMASQLFQQTLANASRPLTWSSAPYGSGQAGQQMAAMTPYAAPAMQPGPQIPGLTLNSLGMGSGYYG
jgi:hypothetical protein